MIAKFYNNVVIETALEQKNDVQFEKCDNVHSMISYLLQIQMILYVTKRENFGVTLRFG